MVPPDTPEQRVIHANHGLSQFSLFPFRDFPTLSLALATDSNEPWLHISHLWLHPAMPIPSNGRILHHLWYQTGHFPRPIALESPASPSPCLRHRSGMPTALNLNNWLEVWNSSSSKCGGGGGGMNGGPINGTVLSCYWPAASPEDAQLTTPFSVKKQSFKLNNQSVATGWQSISDATVTARQTFLFQYGGSNDLIWIFHFIIGFPLHFHFDLTAESQW